MGLCVGFGGLNWRYRDDILGEGVCFCAQCARCMCVGADLATSVVVAWVWKVSKQVITKSGKSHQMPSFISQAHTAFFSLSGYVQNAGGSLRPEGPFPRGPTFIVLFFSQQLRSPIIRDFDHDFNFIFQLVLF